MTFLLILTLKVNICQILSRVVGMVCRRGVGGHGPLRLEGATAEDGKRDRFPLAAVSLACVAGFTFDLHSQQWRRVPSGPEDPSHAQHAPVDSSSLLGGRRKTARRYTAFRFLYNIFLTGASKQKRERKKARGGRNKFMNLHFLFSISPF